MGQNPSLEAILRELGTQAHVYVGTGLGDFPLHYECALRYYRAQKRWNRFWCQERFHRELSAYRKASPEEQGRARLAIGAPEDPASLRPWSEDSEDVWEAWYAFWVRRSDGLRAYLDELREFEKENVGEDIETGKGHLIRRKAAARRRLNAKYGCPTEPWNAVDTNLPELLVLAFVVQEHLV